MDELPPLPKGYMLATFGESYIEDSEATPVLYSRKGWSEWHWWGSIRPQDWRLKQVFAIPKPRYTCPLEVSSDS